MTPPPRKKSLGKGLVALLGEEDTDTSGDDTGTGSDTGTSDFCHVDTRVLRPNPSQPRKNFQENELDELEASIRTSGILQPVLVRKKDGLAAGNYEIVSGERRWRAARRAGIEKIPVIIRELTDREVLEISLIENIQRKDLSPVEEAQTYERLINGFGHTQIELSRQLGKSRSHIANSLRLLSLPAGVLELLGDGKLTAGHARALVNCPSAQELAEYIVQEGLSVRETERLAGREGLPLPTPPIPGTVRVPREKAPETREMEKRLGKALGHRVSIRVTATGKSRLSILCKNPDDLMKICNRFL